MTATASSPLHHPNSVKCPQRNAEALPPPQHSKSRVLANPNSPKKTTSAPNKKPKSKKHSTSSPLQTKHSPTKKRVLFPEVMFGKLWCTLAPLPPRDPSSYGLAGSATDEIRCDRALNLPPSDSSELQTILSATDPTITGYIPYGPFVAVAAAKLHSRDEIDEDAIAAEVDAAYRLFTRGSDGPITLNHLKRIAREVKEDSVGEELLRDMILEANGGGVGEGVTREQFRDVMARAGVF